MVHLSFASEAIFLASVPYSFTSKVKVVFKKHLVKQLLGKKAKRKLGEASIFQLYIDSCAMRGAEKQFLEISCFIWTCLVREAGKRFHLTENQLKLSIIFSRLGTSGFHLTETSRATLMAASPCKS